MGVTFGGGSAQTQAAYDQMPMPIWLCYRNRNRFLPRFLPRIPNAAEAFAYGGGRYRRAIFKPIIAPLRKQLNVHLMQGLKSQEKAYLNREAGYHHAKPLKAPDRIDEMLWGGHKWCRSHKDNPQWDYGNFGEFADKVRILRDYVDEQKPHGFRQLWHDKCDVNKYYTP